jgi:unsaturated rhamnogalacturonyl hydrolase
MVDGETNRRFASIRRWTAPAIVLLCLCACSAVSDPSDPSDPSDVRPSDVRPSDVRPSDVRPSDVRPSDPFPPDPASENVELALAIAQRQMSVHPAPELAWNWEEAVLMAGFAELYRVTQAPELLEYMQAWMDHHIQAGYKIQSSDTCAPAATAAFLFGITQDVEYRVVVEDALSYLAEVALRTPEGGISHLGTFPVVTLWIDSLFMFGNVLLEWAAAQEGLPAAAGSEESAASLDLFGSQYQVFALKLQDDSGFFTHASDWVVEQTPGAFWARGNGWVVAAGYNYLRQRTLRGQEDPEVRESLSKLVAAVLSAQDPSTGLWWTMLSHPGKYYLETSASALFAYGIARAWRYGLAGDEALPIVSLALDGIRSRIGKDEEGRPLVTGISGPTSADKLEEYGKVLLADDLPYGVGAVIMALVETSGLPLEGAGM